MLNKTDTKAIKAELVDFLKTNIVAVIATFNKETLNNSMVYYTIDSDCNFYFETLKTTNKCQNLKTTSQAALVIANAEYLISVQVKGQAVELFGKEKSQIRKELIEKRGDFKVKKWPPHDLRELKDNNFSTNKVTFKITPYELSFFNLGEKSYPASLSSASGHVIINKNNKEK